MSTTWKIVIGVVLAIVVIGVIAAAFLAGSRMISRRWAVRGSLADLGPRDEFGPGRWAPFRHDHGPGRGMLPFGRSLGRGVHWGMGWVGAPLALLGGLVRLAFFGALVWLAVAYFRLRRQIVGTRSGAAPASAAADRGGSDSSQ